MDNKIKSCDFLSKHSNSDFVHPAQNSIGIVVRLHSQHIMIYHAHSNIFFCV